MYDDNFLLEELKMRIRQVNCPQRGRIPSDIPLMRRHYKQIANLISCVLDQTELLSATQKRDMGTSLSWATLERLFKKEYTLKARMDKRRLVTLHKLSVFVGFKSWEVFCEEMRRQQQHKASLNDPLDVVKNGLRAEFEAYKRLPNIELDDLKKCFTKGSLAYERIVLILNKNKERNWMIANDLNPSNYEILDIDIVKQAANKIEIVTRECWYLRWYNPATEKYTFIYNELNEQRYFLERSNDRSEWKIKINYYESTNIDFVG